MFWWPPSSGQKSGWSRVAVQYTRNEVGARVRGAGGSIVSKRAIVTPTSTPDPLVTVGLVFWN